METICIGVHVHAEPERLAATLESLRRNTRRAYDVMLLPDGPDEATAAVLNGLRHVPQSGTTEPLGPPACFNRLITSSDAEITILLESGALVGPNWLDVLAAALLSDHRNGLAGPSTNRSWNEQAVFPRSGGTLADVAQAAQRVAQRYGNQTRSLEPLYSLGDFCYVVRREVIRAIGMADEAYSLGPCWEMDYNIRAARAGFRGVWACGAYVHRLPFTARRQREERLRFEASRHLYQDRFCGRRIRGETNGYEPHCRGEACEHFAPPDLIRVTLQSGSGDLPSEKGSELSGNTAPADILPQESVVRANAGTDARSIPLSTSGVKGVHAASSSSTETSTMSGLPLISCIMPTRNRRNFVRQSIAYFDRQDYPNRELVIVDDGTESVADLIPADARFRYIALAEQLSIGAKRNIACEHARGAIVAQWDDDDWYAPHRLRHQVAPLLEKRADITGLETSCFFDLTRWEAWTCTAALHQRLFVGDVHGGTLVYWRRVWQELAQYPSLSLAEDARFLQQVCRRGARLQKLPHANSFAYIRHGSNAWRLQPGSYLQPSEWRRVDPQRFIPPSDLAFYATHSPAGPPPPGLASDEKSEPELLVSCIMPTCNRRTYVPQAIAYFLRQDYPHRELIILDDGDQSVQDLIPPDPRIRYLRLEKRLILGAKRNVCCSEARGAIIVHWDDDDWMAPHRLRYQVEALERAGADLCGTNRQLYYKPATDQAWLYEYPLQAKRWFVGNTLGYRKSLWERNPFPQVAIGEDTRFVWSSQAKNAVLLPDHRFYVGMVHTANTSSKSVAGVYWKPHPVEEVHQLLSDDLSFYLSLGLLRSV